MADEKKLGIVPKYYIRKEDGEIDYEHPYDYIEKDLHGGLHYVRQGGKIGFMDANGKFIVPLNYDFTRITYEGKKNWHHGNRSWYPVTGTKTWITEVYKNNGVGVVNNRGEEIVPCEFEDTKPFNFSTSEDFIPVAWPNADKSGIVWGMYDIKAKKISVTPRYEDIDKECNGYASFRENGKWGLIHCKTGKVVVPARYLIEFAINKDGIGIAFEGGSWTYSGINCKGINADDCHVIVTKGENEAQVIISGYKWIEFSSKNVVQCWQEHKHKNTESDSFKILPMPEYIGILENAEYEAGYFLEESGEFVERWTVNCTSVSKLEHAKYISGGTVTVKGYDGKDISLTEKILQEIQKRIREE